MIRVLFVLLIVSLLSCTKKAPVDALTDDKPVASKSFQVSGVAIGYGEFTPYLCFQLVGGLFMVKNQFYTMKATKLTKESDKERARALMEKTSKISGLMTNKSKEIEEMRKDASIPFEERSKKTIGLLVGGFDTMKHFNSEVTGLCEKEAQVIKDQCYKMKNQELFSKCYDEMGQELNKKVLNYFNENYAN